MAMEKNKIMSSDDTPMYLGNIEIQRVEELMEG